MRQTLFELLEESLAFPPLNYALQEPNGLLAIGGDLSISRLCAAYEHGVFPWFNDNEPILWWSPDPRAIIPCQHIRINRSLRKFLHKCPYRITLNKAFEQVIAGCADAPFRRQDTWISTQMQQAYIALHHAGYAHSIEVWQQHQLVGGLYGVAINGFFSGESMYYAASNASKVALVALAKLLDAMSVPFIDCQINNAFLADMGAKEIARDEFVILKERAIKQHLPANCWQARDLTLT